MVPVVDTPNIIDTIGYKFIVLDNNVVIIDAQKAYVVK
tara:strand:+ start:1410 stop:1523 length:114 start_codon:yes stop_codon:yes gene_type:complete